jgi:hypothetical protein
MDCTLFQLARQLCNSFLFDQSLGLHGVACVCNFESLCHWRLLASVDVDQILTTPGLDRAIGEGERVLR